MYYRCGSGAEIFCWWLSFGAAEVIQISCWTCSHKVFCTIKKFLENNSVTNTVRLHLYLQGWTLLHVCCFYLKSVAKSFLTRVLLILLLVLELHCILARTEHYMISFMWDFLHSCIGVCLLLGHQFCLQYQGLDRKTTSHFAHLITFFLETYWISGWILCTPCAHIPLWTSVILTSGQD